MKIRSILSLAGRSAITLLALGWIFRKVEMGKLRLALGSADPAWGLAATIFYFAAQLACVSRWRILVPKHPALTWRFLADSFFVGSFFNSFLPTTVGGDVVRGYDLIKATGQWRESLASILADRLIGFTGLALLAFAAWGLFPPARQEPALRWAFFGFCAVVAATFSVLGSRRLLNGMLKSFSKIGLGQLQSHARQFQETLLAYLKEPKRLLAAFSITFLVQGFGLAMFIAAAKALSLPIPLLFLILVVPIIMTAAQIPISLSGWGVREGATVWLLGAIGIGSAEAFSLSLLCAAIPLLGGVIGAGLFLMRRRRPKARS